MVNSFLYNNLYGKLHVELKGGSCFCPYPTKVSLPLKFYLSLVFKRSVPAHFEIAKFPFHGDPKRDEWFVVPPVLAQTESPLIVEVERYRPSSDP